MGDRFKVAIVQTDIVWKNQKENLSCCQKLLSEIHDKTDLVVFPEMFTTGFLNDPANYAESMDGSSVSWMQKMAEEHHTAISGSLIIRESGSFYNRFILASPDGALQYYDKRHLFTVNNEELLYKQGNRRKIFKLGNWRICPQVCYDLRFPVWSRNRNDYDILIYSANWPAVRIDVWKTLLQARATENISYCIGVNRIGEDGNGISYTGESRVVDFKGKIMADLSPQFNGIYTVEFQMDELRKFRDNFPALKDADDFYMNDVL